MKRDGFRNIFSILLVAAALLPFSSCENQAFLPPYETVQSGEISASVKTGDMIPGGQTIQLSMEIDRGSENPPDKLEIEMFDSEYRSLGLRVLTGEELEQALPPISISDEQRGLLTLSMRLYNDQNDLIQEKNVSFFRVDSLPVIQRIDVYPPDAVSPQASGVLIPSIKNGQDCWLRWSMGGDLLGRGRYSDFREGFVWTAPVQEGVYSVSLEVFPQVPSDPEAGYTFSSPLSAEVQFFVQSQNGSAPGELQPQSGFRTLYHLRGSLEDMGYSAVDPRYEGNPVPAVRDGMFGYRLTADDSIIIPEVSLYNARTDSLEPFTFKVIWNPSFAEQPKRHIASFTAGPGDVLLSIVTDESGHPQLMLPQLRARGMTATDFSISSTSEISVSFFQVGDAVHAKWYLDGRMAGHDQIPAEFFPVLRETELRFGGGLNQYPGFEGLLDEVGIFSADESGNPSMDTDIFGKWAARSVGSRTILFADGFESESEDNLKLVPGQGTLIAEFLPEWTFAVASVYFESLSAADPLMLSFSAGDGNGDGTGVDIPSIQIFRTFIPPGGGSKTGSLRFIMRRDNNACIISTVDGTELYRNEEWGGSTIRLSGLVSDGEPLHVSEVLITREQSSLTMNGRQQSSTENVAFQVNQ